MDPLSGQEKWDFIQDLRKKGVDDKEIAKSLGYTVVQSMWNWISRNKDKYETSSRQSFLSSVINVLAGENTQAYLSGLLIGHVLRDLIDTGIDPEMTGKINEFSAYSTIWGSLFFKDSFQKGLIQGLGIRDIPKMVADLSEWYERLRDQN